jgi:hypothetical protein
MERITCALCGLKFDPAAATTCGGCVLNKNCELICCPNCGYEIPPESSLVTFVRKIFKRRVKAV